MIPVKRTCTRNAHCSNVLGLAQLDNPTPNENEISPLNVANINRTGRLFFWREEYVCSGYARRVG
jgi:hypothetical protein